MYLKSLDEQIGEGICWREEAWICWSAGEDSVHPSRHFQPFSDSTNWWALRYVYHEFVDCLSYLQGWLYGKGCRSKRREKEKKFSALDLHSFPDYISLVILPFSCIYVCLFSGKKNLVTVLVDYTCWISTFFTLSVNLMQFTSFGIFVSSISLNKVDVMSDDPEREARVSMRLKFNPRHITELEEWIDRYDSRLPTLTNFILPVSHFAILLFLKCCPH